MTIVGCQNQNGANDNGDLPQCGNNRRHQKLRVVGILVKKWRYLCAHGHRAPHGRKGSMRFGGEIFHHIHLSIKCALCLHHR
ncbi:hypothetical protein DN41_3283 [Vibrio cholerae]|nr:hypothetical protein DN41_3283 [Vibrio cholerae]